MDANDDLVGLYRRAVAGFGTLVHAVAPHQWDRPTPCEGWDVRALVNHVVGENAWAVPLLDGRTIADVGGDLDGDLLGEDPSRSWEDRAAPAVAAVADAGALDRVVHVSFGDIPGREYVSQITTDHIVHSWDLAQGIGASGELGPELVAFAFGFIEPQAEQWRAAGAFGPAVPVPEGASTQARLLGLTGRAP